MWMFNLPGALFTTFTDTVVKNRWLHASRQELSGDAVGSDSGVALVVAPFVDASTALPLAHTGNISRLFSVPKAL